MSTNQFVCQSRSCDTLVHEEKGIPLHLLSSTDFPAWLEQQPPAQKAWLNSQNITKGGFSLVANNQGEIDYAVAVSSNTDDIYAFSFLATSLPPQQYLLADNEYSSNLAMAWGLASYRFDRYKKNDAAQPTLAIANEDLYQQAQQYVQAISLVRDMINMPAGDMMPQHMAQTVESLAQEFGGTFSQIVDQELVEKNYPMIHAVGRASDNRPRLLELNWGDTKHPKVTLVGKGVCFDSGGLDLKPSNAMRNMKKDMGGAAHVLGVAHLIMSHKLPIQLRVLIPAVENAVSANAFRPGDVLNTRKGLSIEIDNTDAEGRLVLCDALADACEKEPELIIDFATLTGACRVALGTELPGYFSTHDDVAQALFDAGNQSQDPVWRLPLHQAYKDMLNSDVADMANGAPSPFGGAITAALYLQAFVNADIPWVHFDVMAWNNRPLPGRPVGGEAMGVRAAFEMLQSRYSK